MECRPRMQKQSGILTVLMAVIGGCTLPATPSPIPLSIATAVASPLLAPTHAATIASTSTLALTPTPTSTSTLTPTHTPKPLPPVEQLLARCPTAQEVAVVNADLKLSFDYLRLVRRRCRGHSLPERYSPILLLRPTRHDQHYHERREIHLLERSLG